MNLDHFTLHSAESKSNIEPVDQNYLARYIFPESNRFQHIIGVVQEMKELLQQVVVAECVAEQLITSAYLHDIGYSEKLNVLRFHPLDGAIFCLESGFSKSVVSAVMFHTGAFKDVKVHHNHLSEVYNHCFLELDEMDKLFIYLLTYCDLHRSSTGEKVSLKNRVNEIVQRYGESHQISRFMDNNIHYFQGILDFTRKWIKTNAR